MASSNAVHAAPEGLPSDGPSKASDATNPNLFLEAGLHKPGCPFPTVTLTWTSSGDTQRFDAYRLQAVGSRHAVIVLSAESVAQDEVVIEDTTAGAREFFLELSDEVFIGADSKQRTYQYHRNRVAAQRGSKPADYILQLNAREDNTGATRGIAPVVVAGSGGCCSVALSQDAFIKRWEFILRQYAPVTPYDQSNDPSEYEANSCGVCLEKLGLCSAQALLLASGCCGGLCTRAGAYCKKRTAKRQFHKEVDEKTIESARTLRRRCLTPVFCAHTLASISIFPIRLIGWAAGNLCQGRTEGYSGPPKGCEKAVLDVIGGGGNGITHGLKAVFHAMRNVLIDAERCWVDYAMHSGGKNSSRLASERARCCVNVAEASYSAYTLWNWDVYTASFGTLTETVDQMVNRDLYLQGPVLLQGYLMLRGGKLQLPIAYCDRCLGYRAWVVVRPWSICMYGSPSQVGSKPLMQLPTSNMAQAELRDPIAEEEHVELRTLDLFFIRFSRDMHRGAEDHLVAEVPMRVWALKMKQAAMRTETLVEYDQGVKHIDRTMYDGSDVGSYTGTWLMEEYDVKRLSQILGYINSKAEGCGAFNCFGLVNVSKRFSIIQTDLTMTVELLVGEVKVRMNEINCPIRQEDDLHTVLYGTFFNTLGFATRTYRRDRSIVMHRHHVSKGYQLAEVFSLENRTDGLRLVVRYMHSPCGSMDLGVSPVDDGELVGCIVARLEEEYVLDCLQEWRAFEGEDDRIAAVKPPDIVDGMNRLARQNSIRTMKKGTFAPEQLEQLGGNITWL